MLRNGHLENRNIVALMTILTPPPLQKKRKGEQRPVQLFKLTVSTQNLAALKYYQK